MPPLPSEKYDYRACCTPPEYFTWALRIWPTHISRMLSHKFYRPAQFYTNKSVQSSHHKQWQLFIHFYKRRNSVESPKKSVWWMLTVWDDDMQTILCNFLFPLFGYEFGRKLNATLSVEISYSWQRHFLCLNWWLLTGVVEVCVGVNKACTVLKICCN